jgi:hypothetical protein
MAQAPEAHQHKVYHLEKDRSGRAKKRRSEAVIASRWVVLVLRLFHAFLAQLGAFGQIAETPRGMYCGGNQLIDEGRIAASVLIIHVADPSGAAIPARIQVETVGRTELTVDKFANARGEIRLRGLPAGNYWLGTSSPGFNLHFWRLSVPRSGKRKSLNVVLSLGT